MFETKRLRLRAYDPGDLAAFHEWWNDAPLVRWQTAGNIIPVPLAANETRLQSWAKDSLIYCCVETISDRQLVGMVNLWGGDAKNRDYHLAALFGRQFWSQGFGREALGFLVRHAFMELGVHRLSLRTAAANERAIRCYQAIVFKEEGLLRQASFVAGGWEDEMLMGMLRQDLPPA